MSRPPRITGFSYQGRHRYFLTICTLNRQKFFLNSVTVSDTLMQFRKTSEEEEFEILAYCVMPDHVHYLIEGLKDHAG